MDNLPKIDPKRTGKEQSASISRLAEGLPLFISAINFMIVHSALVGRITSVSLVFAVVGLLFVFMGNMMFSLKPNSFAGIKVPWTLADDTNWKVTHRVAGRVWVAAGLLVMIGAFTLPGTIVSRLLLLLVVPMVGIPASYSFWYFKRSGSGSL